MRYFFSGQFSWCCLKNGALKQLEFVQSQALLAYDFVKSYINDILSK